MPEAAVELVDSMGAVHAVGHQQSFFNILLSQNKVYVLFVREGAWYVKKYSN